MNKFYSVTRPEKVLTFEGKNVAKMRCLTGARCQVISGSEGVKWVLNRSLNYIAEEKTGSVCYVAVFWYLLSLELEVKESYRSNQSRVRLVFDWIYVPRFVRFAGRFLHISNKHWQNLVLIPEREELYIQVQFSGYPARLGWVNDALTRITLEMLSTPRSETKRIMGTCMNRIKSQ